MDSTEVVYLGHVIIAEGESLSPNRVQFIQQIPTADTKQMGFHGRTSYCRQWVPSNAEVPETSAHHKLLSALLDAIQCLICLMLSNSQKK